MPAVADRVFFDFATLGLLAGKAFGRFEMKVKVVVEEIHAGAPHALSWRDIKAIVRVANAEFEAFSRLVVHLKATLPGNSRFERPVIYSAIGSRLNVCCRGLSREEATREVLRELVIVGTGVQTRYGHRLSAEELNVIDRRVRTLLPRALGGMADGAA